MNNINQNIIKKYSINKRIFKEILKIINDKFIDTLEISNTLYIYVLKDKYNFDTIILKIYKKKQIIQFLSQGIIKNIQFILSENYPFQSPKSIMINNYNYYSLIQFKTHHSNNCLCCNSLTCNDNWSPAITLDKILDEIYINMNHKLNYSYNICVDKIKNKYLNKDIPIMDFL